MKNLTTLYHAATAAALLALLTACEYKELGDTYEIPVDAKRRITIHYDWSHVDSIPPSMRVAWYPRDVTPYPKSYQLLDILSRDTTVYVGMGSYDVVAWNNDAEHVLTPWQNMSQAATVMATTAPYDAHGSKSIPKVLDSLYNGQRVLDYPDYMVHTVAQPFTVENKVGEQVITLTPDSMVITVHVRLAKIAGLEYCQRIRGAVNNVTEKRYMAYDNKKEGMVAVIFDAQPNVADSCVTATFWVFGIEPDYHKLMTFFWLDGGQLYVTIDITDMINDGMKHAKEIFIDIPDLNINLADYVIKPGSGFIVDADDWQNVETIPIDF